MNKEGNFAIGGNIDQKREAYLEQAKYVVESSMIPVVVKKEGPDALKVKLVKLESILKRIKSLPSLAEVTARIVQGNNTDDDLVALGTIMTEGNGLAAEMADMLGRILAPGGDSRDIQPPEFFISRKQGNA